MIERRCRKQVEEALDDQAGVVPRPRNSLNHTTGSFFCCISYRNLIKLLCPAGHFADLGRLGSYYSVTLSF